ncbi:hypothetical protein ACHWQZ_G003637 [Mnemiopsis leidyi]
MSHSTYNIQWNEAQNHIKELLEYEAAPETQKPETDRVSAFQTAAVIYIKYIQVFRKLEECYYQIVHPQKRIVLKHVLDGTMGRLLELKNEMVNLEFSEYHFFDDVLSDMKLTPADIEIPVPRYFTQDNEKDIKDRMKLMAETLAKYRLDETSDKKEEIKMSLEEAIKIIQVHERARQGCLRAKFMREIRAQEEREKMLAMQGASTMDPDVASTIIQKVWKGYSQRNKTLKLREEELIFIGMQPGSDTPTHHKDSPVSKVSKREEERVLIQAQHEREYQDALVNIKEKIREAEGPDIKENMQDQIRQWFIETRDATGKFPDYPSDDEGGSAAIFKTKNGEGGEDGAEGEGGKKKGKKGKKKKGEKKEKKKKGKKKGGKGKEGGGDDEEGFKMVPSMFIPGIEEASSTYEDIWKHRDETENFQQKYDAELIKELKRFEVEDEVRLLVDAQMREELKQLKEAIERDKGKKGKKGKKSGKKKGGKKKDKKGGKKGKKDKDLTPDRTIESLYEELVKEGILVQYPKVKISDYMGEYSYLGTTLRQANIEPMPSLSDVRRVITEYGILPMGSQTVHETAPHVKSIMIAGPHGTGKRMLVNAICSELGANLIDLTAENICGRYPGKAGLTMLLHLVMKVGKLLQPTVVYIGNAEKTFVKKVPKNDMSDPKRLKKELPKIIKKLSPEDRILFVGTSLTPWDADVKSLCQCYQKIVLIPRPDYASRFLLFKELILRNGGRLAPTLDLSSLAKISDGYTPGHIITAVKHVLTERRVQQLHRKPLTALEFVTPLARIDPIYKEEEEQFKAFYDKTTMGKKRQMLLKGDEE